MATVIQAGSATDTNLKNITNGLNQVLNTPNITLVSLSITQAFNGAYTVLFVLQSTSPNGFGDWDLSNGLPLPTE